MTPYKFQSKECFDIWDKTPEDKWCVGDYTRDSHGLFCALGWLGYRGFEYRPGGFKYYLVAFISDGLFCFLTPSSTIKKLFCTETPSQKMITEWQTASPKRRVCDAWIKGVI